MDQTGNTHTLVELSVTAPGHGGVVSAVHLGDVIAFDVRDLVHGQVASKRNLNRKQLRKSKKQNSSSSDNRPSKILHLSQISLKNKIQTGSPDQA